MEQTRREHFAPVALHPADDEIVLAAFAAKREWVERLPG